MRKNTVKILLFTILVASATLRLAAQTTFYNLNTIQKIELFFSQTNWDYQMDTAKAGVGGYTYADSVRINGIRYHYPGVKYKGNSSYDSTYEKNPLHIELDYILNQSHEGVTDIKLSNAYGDPSMIREVLAYSMLKNYMHCPQSNFAQVYINNKYIGLYSNTENIGKDFCSTHFYSSNNEFFKCNPITTPTPLTKSNLKYGSNDSSTYFNYYEMKSNTGWNDLVKLCDTVTNFSSSLSNVIDMDRVLWMLAFNNVLVNLDSYSGVFCQNYYLYKDNTKHYNPVIWDLNMSFGGFPFLGSGSSSMGSLTVSNMQQLPANVHSTDVYWPLIKNSLSDPMYKRMYIAHMRTILNEMFAGGSYLNDAAQLQALTDTAVLADSNKFFTYTQFQNGMTGNATFGSYTVPGISNLMAARITYLQSTADFTAVPPVISNVISDNNSPSLNSTVTITAQVTGSSVVYLGYRDNYANKFSRILMYDDGAHNDGAAGDNVFGVAISVSSAQMYYYVYAENSAAGIFSPERAEHEFYTLTSNLQTAAQGEVAINELMAVNQTGQSNEYGKKEDWIELYNTTATPLNLYGLYLTDDASNLKKFAFPQNTIIAPNGYLIVWADESSSSVNYLHCNFKLSATGEELILSDVAGNILDSVYFGAQTADISMGRCPDGTGAFTTFSGGTFAAQNCPVGIEETNEQASFSVHPNPANTGSIQVKAQSGISIEVLELYDATGKRIYALAGIHAEEQKLDVSQWMPGIYFLRINEHSTKKIIIGR